MRLICPNCGAQYEVDAGLIPPEGRDVQCSNCATTWYHEGSGRGQSAGPLVEESAPSVPVEDDPAPAAAPEPRRRTRAQADASGDDGMDILREEAEHEARLRNAEPEPLETQAELGLDDSSVEERAMSKRAAAMAGIEREKPPLERIENEPEIIAAPATPPDGRPGGSRRDLLPDIEEINSTLRPDERALEDEDLDDDLREAIAKREMKRHKGGVRAGFLTIALLGTVALGAYAFAPEITAQVPQAEPTLAAYVTWVDGLRAGLDNGVRSLVDRLGDAAASASSGES